MVVSSSGGVDLNLVLMSYMLLQVTYMSAV
jgi:hypothetical protein